MSRKTEQELLDVAKWFHFHKDDNMDIEQRLKFMTKAMDMMLWVLAGNIGDVQKLEGGPRMTLPRDLVMINRGIRTATGHTYSE